MTTPSNPNQPVGNKLPETDYYHDKDTTGTAVPELIDAAAATAADDQISWDSTIHVPLTTPPNFERDLIEAVPVKVVDVAEKVRRVKHTVQVTTVRAGECVPVLGKDPTRVRARLVETGGTTDAYLVQSLTYSAAVGFPLASLSELETEEVLYVYNAGAATITVRAYAEYVRSDASREERFYGSVQDGKRR